ncbi:unnamed protein product [Coregonus sp. 'balchen']|nr:unnamed protein product [Coregonus sp. 'balchen']
MVTSNQALKAVGLFIAYLLKSITDLFLTKPLWANLKVLEETDLKTTGGIYETYKAKALWEKTGAVIMVVRRPGCLLCRERALYGPVERWMFLSALLRIGVWRSLWRAYRKGCTGNIIKGEGLVLGGVFVIGPKDQGILLEHREKEFGDKVNLLAE